MRRATAGLAALGLGGLTWLAGPACTLTLPGSSDAGANDAPVASVGTVGQVCTQILTELCTQAIDRCGEMGFGISDCVTDDMSQCCSATCGTASTASSGTVDACKSAFDTEDCNSIVNSTTPSECESLLESDQ